MTTNDHGSPHRGLPPLSGRTPFGGPRPVLAAPAEPRVQSVDDAAGTTRWRIGFALLLAGTAVLYLWGLGASGWANDFYSAAAQAGSQSWKALFFGSSDAANAITVDKPPASLWLMGLSVRVFGLSSWSILIPQALLGVGSVAVLALTVRRWFGSGAALLAGAVLALTPVAVLMFRFNNPDALLVFLLVAGAYAMTRAVERANVWWVVAAGSLVGFAFLTKMLQALLVLPAFALVYLVAAPTGLRRRIAHVLAGGAAMVVSAGWWVAAVEMWPASSRPYIGGSQNNSVLELIFGYNGFGRLTGNQVGSVGGGGGGGGGGRWGETGWDRMFQASWSGQIAWLIPAAALAIVVALVLSRRADRTDRLRAATILWGGWFLVTMLTFSFGQGIIHEYYSVALAPAIGALVAIVGRELWRRRDDMIARVVLAAGVVVTAFTARSILGNASDWNPWLSSLVVAVGIGAAVLLVAGDRWHARARAAAVTAAVAALLLAPSAYALQTASTPHAGAIPSAGPQVDRGFGGMGGRAGQRMGQGGPPAGLGTAPGGRQGGSSNGMPGSPFDGASGSPSSGMAPGGFGQNPGAVGFGPSGSASQSGSGSRWGARGSGSGATQGSGQSTARSRFGGGGGGAGGLLRAGTPSTEAVSALTRNADDFTWVAATVGSNSAAGFQLATEKPVMAIGGFNGSDPSPTLEEFIALVERGRIHWFIGGARMGGGQMGGSRASSEIASWVAQNFEAQEIGNTTMYDLSLPVGGS